MGDPPHQSKRSFRILGVVTTALPSGPVWVSLPFSFSSFCRLTRHSLLAKDRVGTGIVPSLTMDLVEHHDLVLFLGKALLNNEVGDCESGQSATIYTI